MSSTCPPHIHSTHSPPHTCDVIIPVPLAPRPPPPSHPSVPQQASKSDAEASASSASDSSDAQNFGPIHMEGAGSSSSDLSALLDTMLDADDGGIPAPTVEVPIHLLTTSETI